MGRYLGNGMYVTDEQYKKMQEDYDRNYSFTLNNTGNYCNFNYENNKTFYANNGQYSKHYF